MDDLEKSLNLQISPKYDLYMPNLKYKAGSRWNIWHFPEDTLNKYVWTWWIPCKLADRRKPIWVALPCWDVSRYCSSGSSMSFNRWPMFCVRGNPFPPWGGCLDTVLPVRILPRGPPDEIHWLQTVVTIGETSQRSTLWRWTLTQDTWRMSVRLHEFASS